MNYKLFILIFYHFSLISTVDHENIFTIQESNIVRIPVSQKAQYIYRVNPFYEELVLIIVVKSTISVNRLFNIELYIASFKTERANKLNSPITWIKDYNLDVFWVKDYIVVFDQPSKKYYYLNNSAEKPKEISLRDGYINLLINKYYPHMFVSLYKDNSVANLVSVNFGESYIFLPLSGRDYCWIDKTELLATHEKLEANTQETDVLYVRNHLNSQNIDILTVENLLRFKVVETYIFIISKRVKMFLTYQNNQVHKDYFVYDASSKKINVMIMPQDYENPIFKSIYYDSKYIFIVLQDDANSCILRSDNNILKFKTIKCDVQTHCLPNDCEFAFSNKAHLIYANIYNPNLKSYETLYSADDGDNWNRFKVLYNPNSERYEFSNFRLNLIHNVKRKDNIKPNFLDTFSREVNVDDASYSKYYYTKDIGILITFDFFLKDINVFNHYEMFIVTRNMDNIVFFYYKIGNIYERIVIQHELKKINPKYLTNKQYPTIILLHFKDDEAFQKYLNILFFRIIPSTSYICDDSKYHIRDRICKKGILYAYMERKDNSICFYPTNFEFHQIINHCPCSFEESYCKIRYEVVDQECKPTDTAIDTAVYCNNGKLKLSHINGLRKILDKQCDYDFSKDNDADQNNICGYFDDPDYLKIILNSSLVTVYMDTDGKHFSKPPISIENISDNPSISKIWDNDVNMDVLYFAKENIILKVENAYKRYKEMKSQELFWLEEQITGIVFDKSSGSLFVSDSISNIYQISLLSNFKKRILISGRILSFNKIKRTISYINELNKVCTQTVYLKSICITLKEPVVYGHLDLETETSFILYNNKSLIIQQGITNYEFLKEIIDVSFIRIIDYSLYFVSNKTVFYINIKNPSLYYKIFDLETPDISMLFVRDSYKEIPENSLHCDYINEVNFKFEGNCVCPTGAEQNENICECPNNLKFQKSLCLGFFCANAKCLTYNIRCDGVNDCEDSSDEANCKKICPISEYLCKNECQSKNKICQEFNQVPNINTCKVETDNIMKYLFLWLLGIVLLFVFIYIGYRVFRHYQLIRSEKQKINT